MRPDASDSTNGSQARKYRSKRQRPCDLCRQRKTQCKIPASGGACELCDKLGRSCTFVLQPLRKERWQPLETDSRPGRPFTQTQAIPAPPYGTQSDPNTYTDGPMAIDVADFENADLHFDIDVDSQTILPMSSQLPFLRQRIDSQSGPIDWSYLNFPICKSIACAANIHG